MCLRDGRNRSGNCSALPEGGETPACRQTFSNRAHSPSHAHSNWCCAGRWIQLELSPHRDQYPCGSNAHIFPIDPRTAYLSYIFTIRYLPLQRMPFCKLVTAVLPSLAGLRRNRVLVSSRQAHLATFSFKYRLSALNKLDLSSQRRTGLALSNHAVLGPADR